MRPRFLGNEHSCPGQARVTCFNDEELYEDARLRHLAAARQEWDALFTGNAGIDSGTDL